MNTVFETAWAVRLRSGAQQPVMRFDGHPGMSDGEAVEAAIAVSDITAAWPRGNGLTAKSWRLYG